MVITETLTLEIDMQFNQKIFHPGETLDEKLDAMELTLQLFMSKFSPSNEGNNKNRNMNE